MRGSVVKHGNGYFYTAHGLNDFQYGHKSASWLDCSDAWQHYESIPELRAVVNRRAAMFAAGMPCVKDQEGATVEDHNMLERIEQPNVLQSWAEWAQNHSIQECVFGTAIIYQPSTIGDLSALWTLPGQHMKIDTSGKLFEQTELSEIITKVTLETGSGQNEVYDTANLIFRNLSNIANPVIGASPVSVLQKPLSNIALSYETRNVILGNRGALSIISTEKYDDSGPLPLTPQEQQQLEEQYGSDYGIGKNQRKIQISKVPLKVSHTTPPVKDMMVFEEVTEDARAIMHQYGVSPYLFDAKATYDNVREGKKATYQDTIIPYANDLARAFTSDWQQRGWLKDGQSFVIDYSHLPILQEDKLKQSQALDKYAQAYQRLVASGMDAAQVEALLVPMLEGV